MNRPGAIQMHLAILDPSLGQDGIGKVADRIGRCAQDYRLHTVVVLQMNVGGASSFAQLRLPPFTDLSNACHSSVNRWNR